MLFNSYQFVFAFLPMVLLGFYLIGRFSRHRAFDWLILTSIFFYAWWRPLNVAIIAPSILVNFLLARLLVRWRGDEAQRRASRRLLLAGIAFNVCFLGYFKYRGFFMGVANDLAGTQFALPHLILPLAISFITFQKIAFLVDAYGGRVDRFSLREYCLFVLFFPQLIAGPIVHYREMMPQFRAARCRFDYGNVTVGLTLFVFGLFKKVILADGIAAYVTPIYERAAGGASVSLIAAWVAAVGFTLQIYFDFSGYTDMALGLGRFFGIRLPANFDSPLRATNIIDYWLRWNITLTRFLTAYIYNPIVLALTRRRMARGRPPLRAGNATAGAFMTLLAFPTILTMLVSGLWHGAGYLFVLWGLVHGLYITINHAWRTVGPRLWSSRESYARTMRPVGFILTFLSVIFAMVLFRAPTMKAASGVFAGMLGLEGLAVPASILPHLAPVLSVLHGIRITADPVWGAHDFVKVGAWMLALLGIALLCPNSLQVLARFEPSLETGQRAYAPTPKLVRAAWNATLLWAVAISAVAAVAVMQLGGPSEFLYWQF
ncbi:MAG: MBOAT family O-acyltransferase [Steroidobacteraceae bacterium]